MTQQALIKALIDRHPAAAARVAIGYPLAEAASYVSSLDSELAAALLEAMSVWRAAGIIEELEPERAVEIVIRCDVTAAAQFLRHIRPELRATLLEALREPLPDLERRLRFPTGSVGAASRTAPLALPGDLTAADALDAARGLPEEIAIIYVIERPARLVGAVTLGAALRAEPQTPLEWFARTGLPSLRASLPLSAVRPSATWDGLSELPVVDAADDLVGVLTLSELPQASTAGDLVGVASALAELYIGGMIEAVDEVVAAAVKARP